MSSPQVALLRRDYPGLLLEGDVADIIGRSHSTIRRWRRENRIVPTHYVDQGATRIWLYTEENVQRVREIASEIRPGRKKNAPAPQG